ncbi:helix-turn-helix domain-containing protein [Flexivirga meconopsidis]|uniref:helix-turn-helix domain-containing protein n=1 Tax=Flexivirga meconopsidis TaxID=2977121 RepID=UPI0022400829|nr:TetR/AcrR family transcriptional regulator [Flexivirga meconopsidis]
MTVIRNSPIEEDDLLDAARACLLAVGWRRTTMTDVARRAGVSRMSVYRRWPDMSALTADLMVREWSTIGYQLAARDGMRLDASGIARTVANAAREVHEGELFRKIVEVDPELLLPYLLVRRGRTQTTLLESLAAGIAAAQEAGSVRSGKTELFARTVLLMAYGFVFSVPTMSDDDIEAADLFAQLAIAVENYLR